MVKTGHAGRLSDELANSRSQLRDSLTAMHQRHLETLSQAELTGDDLQAVGVTLRRLEQFWIRAAGP